MGPANDGRSPAPIDRSVLERLRSQFIGSQMFRSTELISTGKLHLRVDLSDEYYPNEVSARLEIRWYRNDDFNFHYQEERQNGVWKCRWDRHPNAHNSRDHFHPPPAASRSDAKNEQWPDDHRDVSRLVLDRIESRIKTLWEQQ